MGITTSTQSEQSPAPRKKPRRRWRLPLLISIILLLGAGTCVFFYDGPSPVAADLVPQRQPLPTAENRFDKLQEAARELQLENAEFFAVREEVDIEHRHRQTIHLILDKNESALRRFHLAIQRGSFQVPPVESSATDTDYLESWADLARLSILRARYLGYLSHYDEALGLLVDLTHFGHHVQGAGGSLFHVLCGMYIQRLAALELIRMADRYPIPAPLLKDTARNLAGSRHHQQGIEDACRVHYQVWTRDLQAIKANRYEGDYPGVENILEAYGTNRLGLRVNQTRQHYAEFWRLKLANLQRPFPETTPIPAPEKPRLSSLLQFITNPNYMGSHIFWALSNPFHKLHPRILRNSNNVAVCRLFLALKAYFLDHGRLPDDLTALIPEYLETVPADAFDGHPLRYNRERQTIYSIGNNLQDGGGTVRPSTRTEFSFKTFWLSADPSLWLYFEDSGDD